MLGGVFSMVNMAYNTRVCSSPRSPKPLRASHTRKTLGAMRVRDAEK